MSRYVPPHQRGGILSTPPASSSLSSSSGLSSSGLSSSLRKTDRSIPGRIPPPTKEEFPSLASAPRPSSEVASSASRFSDLARSWGVQQREQEEVKKRLAKQSITEEILKREKEEKERTFYRVDLARASQLIYQDKSAKGDEEAGRYDLGGAKSVALDDIEQDEDMYVPEEEEERDGAGNIRVVDGGYRKSRYDLY